MNRQGGSLWAITSFFNPARFQRRLTNYRQFRAALQVPLATIELGFTGGWELGPADADLYIRIGHGDLLWQKERLLNVIVSRLPPDCEYIVWLDCDVLFGNSDWPLQLVSALRQSPWFNPSLRCATCPVMAARIPPA